MYNKLYFGYGANSSVKMISAIIGRKPQGFPALLPDYSLFLQSWNEIPKKARENLSKNWNPKFRSYIAVPIKKGVVYGKAWRISKKELDLIGLWELHHIWYTPVKIKIVDERGIKHIAETEIIQMTKMKSPIIIKSYKKFPNNMKKMLSVAKDLRFRNKSL